MKGHSLDRAAIFTLFTQATEYLAGKTVEWLPSNRLAQAVIDLCVTVEAADQRAANTEAETAKLRGLLSRTATYALSLDDPSEALVAEIRDALRTPKGGEA